MEKSGPRLKPRAAAERSYSELQRSTLKGQFQTELDEARVVNGIADGAEAGSVQVRNAKAAGAIRSRKLGVIKKVEHLEAEIQTQIFPGELELLDEGKVRIHKVRSGGWGARGISQLAVGGLNETGGVEPLGDGVRTRIGITSGNEIGTGQAIGIIVEEADAGIVVAGHDENREARCNFLDNRNLPVA